MVLILESNDDDTVTYDDVNDSNELVVVNPKSITCELPETIPFGTSVIPVYEI
jgi:hypothetical protein